MKKENYAGHDDQFVHAARRRRSLVQSGGQRPAAHGKLLCYEIGGAYASALFGDKRHWVRRLPGKLLHNVISHGIARISSF